MPSYELESYSPCHAVRVVAATELLLPASIKLIFLVMDPENQVAWPESKSIPTQNVVSEQQWGLLKRADYLWQHTCFELFVGIKDQPDYREINLSPAQAWQCYQFEDYRQPDQMPPLAANDIELIDFAASTGKLQATLNLQGFIEKQDCYLEDLKLGISSVIQLKSGKEHYFALQHTGDIADFHRQADWTIRL